MQAPNTGNAIGLDLSHYNGVIPDWSALVGANVSFVYLKVTEGSSVIDDTFSSNLAGALGAGMIVGAYHFFRASTVAEAEAEAQAYIAAVNQRDGFAQLRLPPALDIETDNSASPADLAAAARRWLEVVEQSTGCRPIVYTYISFANYYLDGKLTDYPLWLAATGTDEIPDCGGWTEWAILQTNHKAEVAGIGGPVDLNQFNGGVDELQALTYRMKPEDVEKVTALLSEAYMLGVTELAGQTVDRPELHRLANEVRKAGGQPVTES